MNSYNLALLFLHVVLGLFFTVSGYRKCFVPRTRGLVAGVLDSHNVPSWQRPLIVWGQLLGGLGLLTGTLTQLAAAGLLVIMGGTIRLSVTRRYKEKAPVDVTDKCYTALNFSEVQIAIGLAVLLISGAGTYSLDYLIFGG